jgi:hypothetical protein
MTLEEVKEAAYRLGVANSGYMRLLHQAHHATNGHLEFEAEWEDSFDCSSSIDRLTDEELEQLEQQFFRGLRECQPHLTERSPRWAAPSEGLGPPLR